MKYLLLTISFFLFHFSFSQDLILVPELVEKTVDIDEFETVGHAFIYNNSENTIEVIWEREINDLSEGWKSAVCDKQACYSTDVDSFSFELAPGDSSNLDIHIRPNQKEGSAEVQIIAYSRDNPTDTVVGKYLFSSTVNTQDTEIASLKLYPNPAQHYFQITSEVDMSKIIIYNVVGKRMIQYLCYPHRKYDISDLERGLYLVRLFDHRGYIIKTLRLNKK